MGTEYRKRGKIEKKKKFFSTASVLMLGFMFLSGR
jgi:hypothetical protein